jgi:cobalt-zinc-cadmium efflux system outer membrane protein
MKAIRSWVCGLLLFSATCFISTQGIAQSGQYPDTLHLSLQQAEQTFLANNLSLLAAHFDIDINKAIVMQSKYWDNPVLSTDQNLYDGGWFRHYDGYGQVYLQLSQLIKTAGKRKKLIQLSTDNVLSAEQQFNDMMRNLHYMLETDLNELSRLQSSKAVYVRESVSLQQLSSAMEAQLAAGNISSKENLRVKGLYFSTQSEEVEVEKQIDDIQRDLHTLLQLQKNSLIDYVADASTNAAVIPPIDALLDTARNNRPDLKLANLGVITQQHNVTYQRALAAPDVTVGVEYDKANSYVPNYWGLAVGLPIPILNRNKGNIKAAEFSVEQAKALQQQSGYKAEQEVIAAYNKYEKSLSICKEGSGQLDQQYDNMLQNMTNSYRQRQIGLLEFIDFFASYKDIKLRRIQQQADLQNAIAELNFTTAHHFN